MRAIRKADKDFGTALKHEIDGYAREVVRTAHGYIPAESPMSGWVPGGAGRWGQRGFDASEIRRGIKVTRSTSSKSARGWVNAIGVSNWSAAGVIYEGAGTKTLGNSKQGRQFVKNIAATGLRTPLHRLVVRAAIEDEKKAATKIQDAIDRAVARFNSGSPA